MANSFGKTWWGESWLNALSNIDYSNRLPRGATYARNGYVKKIEIFDGVVTARVQGSQKTPYKETLSLKKYDDKQIKLLVDNIVKRPAVISKMLNRELDPSIVKIAESLGIQVFPKSWKDMSMECSCPDWAVPCKHLAAVIYILSQEIDNNPFLIFELHGVNLLLELAMRGISIDSKTSINVPTLDKVIETESVENTNQEMLQPSNQVDFSTIADISESLVGLLAENPAFYHDGDFHQHYFKELKRATQTGLKLKNGKKTMAELLGCGQQSAINPSTKMSLVMDANMHYKVIYFDDNQQVELRLKDAMSALMTVPQTIVDDCHQGVRALRQALFCAIRLLAAGAIIPQIVYINKMNYAMRWLPTRLDKNIDEIINQLDGLFVNGTCLFNPKGKTFEMVKNSAEFAISAFLNELVSCNASRLTYINKCHELFFECNAISFNELGEKETPGGIKSWLDRLHITSGRFRPVIMVKDDENRDKFYVSISVEDKESGDTDFIPLKNVFDEKKYDSCCFEILKDVMMLSSMMPEIDDYINKGASENMEFGIRDFTPFLLKAIPAMRLLGIKVMLPASLKEILRPKVSVKLSKKQKDGNSFIRLDQLLQFSWQIAVGDDTLTEDEFEKLCLKAGNLLYFKQHYIYVSEDDIKKIRKELMSTRELSASQMMQIALAEEYEGAPIQLSDEVRELIKKLTEETEIPIPPSINATLRPYQERGFSWMYRNMRLGFGSIIADDMGLGKTLQVIVLLQKMKDDEMVDKKKILIVVPTGLITNWMAEIARFAPTLTVFTYHGANRNIKDFDSDILLTTYGVMRSDIDILKKQKWAVVVIDEAQNIKNSGTAQSKAVKSIPADVHIAMSGTPVENRLSEYWSIMDFANKGYLGNLKTFAEEFANPIQGANDRIVTERFKRITAPLMMRRLKTDKSVISDLPDKVEQDEFALLSPSQASLYEQTLSEAMNVIEGIDDADEKAMFKRQGLILQMILALKQICNHPAQFLKNGNFEASLSGKAEMLLDLVESIDESGEKALIFTQFKEMGDILCNLVAERTGRQPMFLHGGCSLKQRNEMVERFQNNRTDRIFILSLKAAGTGLNLTAASHVIHYDLWWNPAVEAQATDRAYRIGQHKNVMVHRFITKNTFEERINAMIQQKKQLADLTVATGENWIGKLSNSELHEIFDR